MKSGNGWIVVALIAAIFLLFWIVSLLSKARQNEQLRRENALLRDRDRQVAAREAEFSQRQQMIERKKQEILDQEQRINKKFIHDEVAIKQFEQQTREKLIQEHEDLRNIIDKLILEKAIAFPWIAGIISDLTVQKMEAVAEDLESKKRPAFSAAVEVRQAKMQRRNAELERRIFQYRVAYYESLFPWLTDLLEEVDGPSCAPVEKLDAADDDDPAKFFLSAEEYSSLGRAEKFQRALDRYCRQSKSKWEIGREYERYVGHLFEKEGCAVIYQGIVRGYEDLGRDLIASSKGLTNIIQCKNWSKDKQIHEKHVFQLFGTAIEYAISVRGLDVQRKFDFFDGGWAQVGIKPILITSTALSDRARSFADTLGVEVREKVPLGEYPRIKLNVSRRTSERIYHLPFDQQYDKVLVEPRTGEGYAWTVAEAEAKGFRRAFKWMGDS